MTTTNAWLVRDRAGNVAAVAGATYPVTDAGLGKSISVRVLATAPYRDAVVCPDSVSAVVGPRLVLPASAAVSGTRKVGKTLAAVAGAVPPGTTVSYQWLRTTKKAHSKQVTRPIAGATSVAYKLKAKDRTRKVSVLITYANPAYVASSATSATGKKVR